MAAPRRPAGLVATALLACMAAAARASDVGISAKRLVVLDRVAARGTASVVFVSSDPVIALPAGTDTAALQGQLQVFFGQTPSNAATFDLPAPWRKRTTTVATYANPDAPAGGGVRMATVKPGRVAKVTARTLGDGAQIALLGTLPAPGDVRVVLTLADTGSGEIRFCTRFPSVELLPRRDGTSARLVATDGVPAPCPTTIAMEPGAANGFFRMPWPNDVRRLPDGSLDLAGWPGRAENALVDIVLANGAVVTHGFGTNAAVYLQSTAPLDPTSLPDPDATLAATSPVMLVNLDDPGGGRAPLLTDFRDVPTTLRPGSLLSLLPYPGHPLAERTRWAAIVFDGVRDAQGSRLRPASLLRDLDAPWDPTRPVDAPTWAALRAQRDTVRGYVAAHTAWSPAQVVGFTVFTTQDVTRELDAIAAAVNALPPPAPVSRGTGSCPPGTLRATVTGLLDPPVWQAGTRPFDTVGGGIVVAGGAAVQQGTERVVFDMTFPCGPAPADGWPILLFMDGTGGSAESRFIDILGSTPLPYVVASIAPLYSADRALPGLPPEIQFFNYLNPLAGRTNQLQQAADMMFLRRVIEGITLSAAETGAGAPVPTNDALVVITGHSQGALTLPITLAADSAFDAGFVSAGGGGFYHSLVHRADVRSLIESLVAAQPGELDMFHPLFHALQTLAEIGDASNYAARITTAHVVSTGGRIDGCSPLEVVSHLGTALGLPVAHPIVHPLFGSAALEPTVEMLPIAGNLLGGRTGVTVELDTGHFGASTNPDIGRSFVESLAGGGTPLVDPGTLLADDVPGCSGRVAPLP